MVVQVVPAAVVQVLSLVVPVEVVTVMSIIIMHKMELPILVAAEVAVVT